MVKYISGEVTLASVIVASELYLQHVLSSLSVGLLYFLYSTIAVLGIVVGFKMFKRIRVYMQSQFIHTHIEKIGKVVLYSLHELGYVTTALDTIKITSEKLYEGGSICSIQGASRVESSLFVKALQEILNPIENPRYLIERNVLFGEVADWQNYYAVPAIFGGKKEDAEVFLDFWTQFISEANIHFTRSVEGRKLLIKARLFHVTNVFKNTTKKEVIWK